MTGALPGVGVDGSAPIRVRLAPDLDSAFAGADAVICQVRPGGMRARAEDEALAMREGLPGDEGLGPSGLANFLRSRPVMDQLAEGWAKRAPGAAFLQLSSPLSLNVAQVERHTGHVIAGLCELPATVWAAVQHEAAFRLGAGPLRRAHFGSNHWAWLYAFRDEAGRDRTDEVIAALDTRTLAQVEPAICRQERALPLPYLRLLYHPERELRAQQQRRHSRGEELEAWAARLDSAYRAEGGPDARVIAGLLRQRRMNWYEEAVVPMLHVLLGGGERELVLNVTGVEPEIAVELPCMVRGGHVTPIPQLPLPPGPASIFRQIARYERAVLRLPEMPRADQIAEVLSFHPLVADAAHAARLGRSIAGSLQAARAAAASLA